MSDYVSDAEADAIADECVGPILLDSPVARAYGPYTCRCGCGETRSAFNVALEEVELGMSVRNAVENLAMHFDLSEVQQEQLVDDIEEDLCRFPRMFGGGR